MASDWPEEAIERDLADLARAVGARPPGAARGEAGLALFVERYGRERGGRLFARALRLLEYVAAREAELRRLGLLAASDGEWRFEPRFLAELARSL